MILCKVYHFNKPKEAKIEDMKCKMQTANLKTNLFPKLRYTRYTAYTMTD